jgi:hypothetical protein
MAQNFEHQELLKSAEPKLNSAKKIRIYPVSLPAEKQMHLTWRKSLPTLIQ